MVCCLSPLCKASNQISGKKSYTGLEQTSELQHVLSMLCFSHSFLSKPQVMVIALFSICQAHESCSLCLLMYCLAQADCCLHAGLQVWAANGMGKIECLDLRMNKLQGSLKGPGGAVKSLALHPELPIIASVGLDRFLRIHSVDSKALLCKLYLKQHLTAVAWGSVQHQAAAGEEDAADTVELVASGGLKLHMLSDNAIEDAGVKRARSPSSKTTGSQKKGRSQRKKPKLPVQN